MFAPTLRQSQITFGRMRKRLQSKTAQAVLEDVDFNYQFTTANGQTVALTNGSFVQCLSASEGSNIEGESFKFIICEECQDIGNYKIRKSIHPMGAAYNATIAKIGTATTHKGDFFDAIERNKKAYENGELKVKNHFEYDYTVVMKYNINYEKFVKKEMARLGVNSDEFQMSYCLKWILQRGMFIDVDKFEKDCAEPLCHRIMSDLTKTHVVGIDLGGKNDFTVITVLEVDWENPVIAESQYNNETGQEESFVAYNTLIKDWCEIEGDDFNEQYYQILDYLKHFKIAKVVIDATKESSIAHRMRANLPFEVIPFVFGSKSKSELYKKLDGEIKSKRFKYPSHSTVLETREYKKFIQEFTDLEKGYSGSYLTVSHPQEKNAHDDYPDSCALAVWGASEEGETYVIETKSSNPFLEKKGNSVYYNSRNIFTARRR